MWWKASRSNTASTPLVGYEVLERMDSAILREKQIKGWRRAAKLELIEKANPDWRDLWAELTL